MAMPAILVINGPNLDMLGTREPGVYGKGTLHMLEQSVRNHAQRRGVQVDFFQSNSEGDLVTRIQQALGQEDAIIINPAAYTHTSVAILDALRAVALPAVEVHLSRLSGRESFRQISYISPACEKTIEGKGFEGYREAIRFLTREKKKD